MRRQSSSSGHAPFRHFLSQIGGDGVGIFVGRHEIVAIAKPRPIARVTDVHALLNAIQRQLHNVAVRVSGQILAPSGSVEAAGKRDLIEGGWRRQWRWLDSGGALPITRHRST